MHFGHLLIEGHSILGASFLDEVEAEAEGIIQQTARLVQPKAKL